MVVSAGVSEAAGVEYWGSSCHGSSSAGGGDASQRGGQVEVLLLLGELGEVLDGLLAAVPAEAVGGGCGGGEGALEGAVTPKGHRTNRSV